jgi:uncharacterized protein YecA (UPF0149 family)
MPNEWLAIIFNDERHKYVSIGPLRQLVDELLNSYNHYNTMHLKGSLHFPYDPKQMTLDLFDTMKDWCWGFFLGLELRTELWAIGLSARKTRLDRDPIDKSFKIIQFLVGYDFDDVEFIDEIKEGIPDEVNEEDIEMYAEWSCLELLPTIVGNIQEFASEMEKITVADQTVKQTPVQSTDIGLNDPCPCGSGKKYKKCCLH